MTHQPLSVLEFDVVTGWLAPVVPALLTELPQRRRVGNAPLLEGRLALRGSRLDSTNSTVPAAFMRQTPKQVRLLPAVISSTIPSLSSALVGAGGNFAFAYAKSAPASTTN